MIGELQLEERHGARRERERGTVLVVVIWLTMVLITITLYFGHTMLMEFKASANGLGDMAAAQAGDGAVRYLDYVFVNYAEPGQWPYTTDYEYEDVPVGEARYWLLGRDTNSTVQLTEPAFGLVDEASKLNLNTATLEQLEWLPEVPEGLPARIIDWRDEDEDVTDLGAESQDYLLGTPSYYAKNAPFESVEELRMVMLNDGDYFLGEDTNRNGVLDPNEDDGDATPPLDDQDGVLDPGILEYVTVDSREPLTLADGTERINVTENNFQQALQSVLEEQLDSSRAEEIARALGNQQPRSVLEMYANSGMDADEFALVDAYLYQPNPNAPGEEGYVSGLVNVNTASEAVLTCLFEDDAVAAQVVSYRQTLDMNTIDSLAWVVDALGGDMSLIQQIGPLITGVSFRYTADVAAVGANGNGFHREAYTIDTSTDPPEVVYRRDLTRAGWPLGAAVREATRSAMEERKMF